MPKALEEKRLEYQERLRNDPDFFNASLKDQAYSFGVSKSTIFKWRSEMKSGKEAPPSRAKVVAEALFERIQKHGDPQAVKVWNEVYKNADLESEEFKLVSNDQLLGDVIKIVLGRQPGYGKAKILKLIEMVEQGVEIPPFLKLDEAATGA